MSKSSCKTAKSTVGAVLRMARAELLLLNISNTPIAVEKQVAKCYNVRKDNGVCCNNMPKSGGFSPYRRIKEDKNVSSLG